MRREFGKIINEIAKKDKKVVLLVGDIGYGIFDDFRRNHPKKFYNSCKPNQCLYENWV